MCKCRFHDASGDKITPPSYPPATTERIAQTLTHDPSSTIALFMDTALRITELYNTNVKDEPEEQDLCVVCNSDYVESSGSFSENVLIRRRRNLLQ